ncbi:fumarylacetoacetate hydrolase family protein [Subtercola endophyticus]|uniref:fumarylacetoacetate hydrolase family protein n=1 Tax=Subtercola endophyticus TaxID=2895559 RepID=UPI001E4BC1D2|nr:fumarylacetoacetate hydrolase family protein [Subtercola endophyticus]UFS59797.1 fumarylacetoacetate hydrolase family protein [Subtercola endophyticus]
MPYLSYEMNGRAGVGQLIGNSVIPLEGFTELGKDTPLARLSSAKRLESSAFDLDEARIRPVVPNPPRIFCVGLNYASHVAETKRADSDYPVLFPKFAGSLIGARDSITLPPESSQVDYEGELAVVIGTGGRRISEESAAHHILGYSTANDVTMRDYQYKTHQWMQGKSWDNSTPIGPVLVTPPEVDVSSAGIRTTVNGVEVQNSDLSHLIFSIPRLIHIISEFTALLPGDIILTGTPGGVGYRREPQLFLFDGDVVTVEIDGVGSITNNCVAE